MSRQSRRRHRQQNQGAAPETFEQFVTRVAGGTLQPWQLDMVRLIERTARTNARRREAFEALRARLQRKPGIQWPTFVIDELGKVPAFMGMDFGKPGAEHTATSPTTARGSESKPYGPPGGALDRIAKLEDLIDPNLKGKRIVPRVTALESAFGQMSTDVANLSAARGKLVTTDLELRSYNASLGLRVSTLEQLRDRENADGRITALEKPAPGPASPDYVVRQLQALGSDVARIKLQVGEPINAPAVALRMADFERRFRQFEKTTHERLVALESQDVYQTDCPGIVVPPGVVIPTGAQWYCSICNSLIAPEQVGLRHRPSGSVAPGESPKHFHFPHGLRIDGIPTNLLHVVTCDPAKFPWNQPIGGANAVPQAEGDAEAPAVEQTSVRVEPPGLSPAERKLRSAFHLFIDDLTDEQAMAIDQWFSSQKVAIETITTRKCIGAQQRGPK